MDVASGALVSAAALAAGAYLNAKLHIGTDLHQLSNDRAYAKRLTKRIQDLGDTCTIFNIFDKTDPNTEFLWFEGRTWTYGQFKNGELQS